MHVYRVGYYSYEGSPYTYLTHEIAFDQEEFQQMVVEAAVLVAKRWLVIEPALYEITPNLPSSFLSHFDELVTYLAPCLIEERGFRPLNLQASTGFDGWASLFEETGSYRGFPLSTDPVNLAVTSRLIEEGLAAPVVAKNQKLRKLHEAEDALLDATLAVVAKNDDDAS